jgi:hypothetical protein
MSLFAVLVVLALAATVRGAALHDGSARQSGRAARAHAGGSGARRLAQAPHRDDRGARAQRRPHDELEKVAHYIEATLASLGYAVGRREFLADGNPSRFFPGGYHAK